MDEENFKRRKKRLAGLERRQTPQFVQEWFYGPYQSLTSEQICLTDPIWLSEAISQEIISGKDYYESRLQKLAEINPEFSISFQAKNVIAEKNAKWEARMAAEKKEKERIENLMTARDLKYSQFSKETKEAHLKEIEELVGPWFKNFRDKLERGRYQGYTPIEILEKHPQDVMDAFSKSIVDHYHFPHERLLEKIKHYCPGFKLSDEAAIIYKYENDALKMELARQEEMNDLIYEEYIRDMADSFEEPSEESIEDYYDDRLDLDQQHPDFYNQYPDL